MFRASGVGVSGFRLWDVGFWGLGSFLYDLEAF